jgi:glycerol-3-phosphate dehydrogenase (NAD(P)+)
MTRRRPRVAVLGSGSWGTTVASLTARNAPTVLWARSPDVAREIEERHLNSRYLGELPLTQTLEATSSLEAAVAEADLLVMGVPSHGFRAVLEEAVPHLRPWIPVVSLTKGLEQGTRKRMTEIVAESLPGYPAGVLGGPNLAREVLAGYAAAATIAMPEERSATALQKIFRTRVFRVYTSTDVVGVEIAGALKNVFAIAAGMAAGAGTGDNTRAMVITRALRELSRLGAAMGGDPQTFAGLSGMGDLIATCVSPLSRNRHVGEEIARGKTISEIVADMKQVAEGIKTAAVVMELAAQYGVELPIAREVDAVVNHGRTVREAYRGLLRAAPAHEIHGVTW